MPNLQIIVVTMPCQCNKDGTVEGGPKDEWGENAIGYLTRRSWLQIALRQPARNGQSLRYYGKKAGKRVEKTAVRWDNVTDSASRAGWKTNVSATVKNRWLEGDRVTVYTGDGHQERIAFSDIICLETDLYFLTPIRIEEWTAKQQLKYKPLYVHSKLAIIDDRYLIVGSCNWSYRSLRYDGEISAFCENEGLAKAAYRRLISHYDDDRFSKPDQVVPNAVGNVQLFLDDKAGLRFRLVPIEHPRLLWVRFQRVVPTKSLGMPIIEEFYNYTWC